MDNQFRPLHPEEPIRKSCRHLPHWEQDGATYFVTFRTADSLPADCLDRLRKQRDLWLRLHPPPWSSDEYDEYCRAAFHRLDLWLDKLRGACPLRDSALSRIVADALLHFDGVRYCLDESVVMPNHVHSLFKPLGTWHLDQILHSWKSFTAKEINRAMGRSGQFWFHEGFDRIVRDWAELERIRRYIRDNPVKAGLLEGESAFVRGIGLVR